MLFEFKHYSDDRPVCQFYGGPCNFELPRDPEDPSYKYYKYSPMWIDINNKKKLKTDSHREVRRKVRKGLQNEEYELVKSIKPRDISWEIY